MRLENFVGQNKAKLALILNAVDPRCGGALFIGGRGRGKSLLLKLAQTLFSHKRPCIKIPLNVTMDSLLGCVDLEQTIKKGSRCFQPGLLDKAGSGLLIIDDLNLLSGEILSLVMNPENASENYFTILGAMNPEDGELSGHFLDRFGFCLELADLDAPQDRLAIIKVVRDEPYLSCAVDEELSLKIEEAQRRLTEVKITAENLSYINEVADQYHSAGHRGLIFLLHGARALAAFENSRTLSPKHIDQVAEMVFYHRRLRTPEPDFETDPQEDQTDEQPAKEEENQNNIDEQLFDDSVSNDSGGLEEEKRNNPAGSGQESSGREEIMAVGQSYKVKRHNFAKDRLKRTATGRRTKTRIKGFGGRQVKSVLDSPEKDLALEATLRAAAPFQKMRQRVDTLRIEDSDFRYKQKERKMGHLVLFVVDGSGSMGAKERMIETKGAIRSLLLDCYQKRDQVAMISFRKNKAQLILPPTSSVELASRYLAQMPVGGKTPLAHGLLETYKLISRHKLKKPETRFIITLITDGRANQSLSGGSIVDELEKMAYLLAVQKNCDFIVIDTENKSNFLKRDLAAKMALDLGAGYYTTESLKADYLSGLIQENMII